MRLSTILHLGLSFARISRGVGLIQHCDVNVFEKFRFHRPHKNTKKAFPKLSTLERVFGDRFHRIQLDGRPICKEKIAFSNESGYMHVDGALTFMTVIVPHPMFVSHPPR